MKKCKIINCFSGPENVEKDAEQRDREVQLGLPHENNPQHQPARVGPPAGGLQASQTSTFCSTVSSCKVRVTYMLLLPEIHIS